MRKSETSTHNRKLNISEMQGNLSTAIEYKIYIKFGRS